MSLRNSIPRISRRHLTRSFLTLTALALLGAALLSSLSTPSVAQDPFFLVVSRIQYDGNTFGNTIPYPYIFSDPTVSGVQASIHLDLYLPIASTPRLFSLPLNGITTSFSSKSEGALTRAVDGHFLTYNTRVP